MAVVVAPLSVADKAPVLVPLVAFGGSPVDVSVVASDTLSVPEPAPMVAEPVVAVIVAPVVGGEASLVLVQDELAPTVDRTLPRPLPCAARAARRLHVGVRGEAGTADPAAPTTGSIVDRDAVPGGADGAAHRGALSSETPLATRARVDDVD